MWIGPFQLDSDRRRRSSRHRGYDRAWALHCTGIQKHTHYLDVFLLMHTVEATMAMSTALNVLDHLGFPVATHKTEGPSHCITFLGIVIDTKLLSYGYQQTKSNGYQQTKSNGCKV